MAATKEQTTHVLISTATETSRELEHVWDEVGYGPEERKRQFESLLSGFAKLCQDKIRQEKGVRDQFVHSLTATTAEIKDLSQVLGEETPSLLQTDGLNLTEKLAHLEIQVEELRARRDAALERFTVVRTAIVEAADALGERLESRWTDLSKELTLRRWDELVKKQSEMEEAIQHRADTIAELILECQGRMEELRIEDPNEFDSKLQTSLAPGEPNGRPCILSILADDRCVGITFAALTQVLERREELRVEHERRKTKLGEMGDEILMLWEQLDTSEEEQESFKVSVGQSGMGMEKLRAGEAELARLRQLKSERIVELVERERAHIRALWVELGTAAAEGLINFPAFALEGEAMRSDQVLDEHLAETQRLSSLLESMRPMLDKVEEREALCKERMEDLTMEKDPNRLKARCPNLQKQLAAELEKEKRITKRLPKLTDHLRKAVLQWEETHGAPFEWHGTRYLDVIDSSESDYAKAKEEIRLAKVEKKKALATPGKRGSGGGTESKANQMGSSGNLFPRSNSVKTPRKASGSASGSGSSFSSQVLRTNSSSSMKSTSHKIDNSNHSSHKSEQSSADILRDIPEAVIESPTVLSPCVTPVKSDTRAAMSGSTIPLAMPLNDALNALPVKQQALEEISNLANQLADHVVKSPPKHFESGITEVDENSPEGTPRQSLERAVSPPLQVS